MRASVWLFVIVAALPPAAMAFPPYRSTDADTAPHGVLEARLGLVRVERKEDENRYTAPLLRLNFGIAPRAELVIESEYDREEGRIGDGALGLKLVTGEGDLRWGIETLALLPVNSTQSGVGVESQVLATWSRAPLKLHMNAGGIYDPRAEDTEKGWRASLLVEVDGPLGRPGVELFSRRFRGESTETLLGTGWIIPAGPIDIRIGLHAGLTSSAPDWVASIWVSTQRKIWRSRAADMPAMSEAP